MRSTLPTMFSEWPPLEGMARPWWEGAYCLTPTPEWATFRTTVCPNVRSFAGHDHDPWDDVALEGLRDG